MDDFFYQENSQRLDSEAKMRDDKYERDHSEPVHIVKEMMGSDYEKYFQVEEEINRNHAQDCAF
jgi:hypothetical protein